LPDGAHLIVALRERGVTLWAEHSELRFSASNETLTPDDLNSLRVHETEIVQILEDAELMGGVSTEGRSSNHPVPLTALQLRKWKYIHQAKAGLSTNACFIAHRVLGQLDRHALQCSVKAVVERHDALRVQFSLASGVPMQQARSDCSLELEFEDLTRMGGMMNVVSRCEQLIAEPLRLCGGKLFAARLLRLSEREHVFLVVVDHIVSDGVSCQIMAHEIWAAYHNLVHGLPLPPAHSGPQFLDYVAWQCRTHDAWLRRHGGYWRSHFAGLQRRTLAAYDELEPVPCKLRDLAFDEALCRRLRAFARGQRTFLPLVVLAICVVALSRWLRQEDYMVAFITNGRDKLELQRVVGFLAGYLHMRIQPQQEEGLLETLKLVVEEFGSAYEHQDYDRAPDLIPECTLAEECAAEVAFNWTRQPIAQQFTAISNQHEVLTAEPIDLRAAFAFPPPLKLALSFRENRSHVIGGISYRPDIFSAEGVEELTQLLALVAAEVPDRAAQAQ
jgi:hypothetical protein